MTIARNDRRRPLLNLLAAYRPIDDADRAQCARIVKFVDETPACFERSNAAGHVTGSAWVVDKDRARVLLTHHKKLGKWLQLGGHADGDADVPAVALREAQEESGLRDLRLLSKNIFDLDVHPIPAHGADPAHFHYDIRFVFQANGPEPIVTGAESNELAWVDIKNISAYSQEPSLLRMVKKELPS